MVGLGLIFYAFSLGALAFLNPCSFALLPAFISFIMGKENDEKEESQLKTALKGLRNGLSSTLGFATVFVAMGVAVSWIGIQIRTFFPPVFLLIGVFFTILGVFWALNHPVLSLSEYGVEFGLKKSSFYFLGITYALSSLACFFPIFLMLIRSSLFNSGFISSISVFLSFTSGMGLLMVITTTSIAFSKELIIEKFEKAEKYITRISGIVMIIAGILLIHYWITTYLL